MRIRSSSSVIVNLTKPFTSACYFLRYSRKLHQRTLFAMKLDPAIISALNLDASATKITSHGGSGFSSTYQLLTKSSDGTPQKYFVKTGRGEDAAIMFAGMPYFNTLSCIN